MSKKEPSRTLITRWHGMVAWYVAVYGPVAKGEGAVQFHHVKGRAYVHNKIHIGEFFILPLPWELHDVHSNSGLNVTHFPKNFVAEHGKQSELWMSMVEEIRGYYQQLPFGQDVIDAIMDTGL